MDVFISRKLSFLTNINFVSNIDIGLQPESSIRILWSKPWNTGLDITRIIWMSNIVSKCSELIRYIESFIEKEIRVGEDEIGSVPCAR